MLSAVRWCGAFFLGCVHAGYAADTADVPSRGLYWNYSYAETADKDHGFTNAVNYLKRLGVNEVHLWLNNNNPPFSCNYVIDYQDAYWKAGQIRDFIQALGDQRIKTVLTFSPIVPSPRFLKSLTGPDGPFQISRDFAGLDVELDVEGYWTRKMWASPRGESCKTVSIAAASTQLLSDLRTISPRSRLRVTMPNNAAFIADNATFLKAADIVTPQLYGQWYQLATSDAQKDLVAFEKEASDKVVFPGISAQCSIENADAEKCGKKRFDEQLRWMFELHARNAARYPGYVIWAREEIKPKGTKNNPSYSVFGEEYLACTAGRQPNDECK